MAMNVTKAKLDIHKTVSGGCFSVQFSLARGIAVYQGGFEYLVQIKVWPCQTFCLVFSVLVCFAAALSLILPAFVENVILGLRVGVLAQFLGKKITLQRTNNSGPKPHAHRMRLHSKL